MGYCAGWRPTDDGRYESGYADAQVRAILHAKAQLARRADSLATLAARAETVYVATRRRAAAQVAELPAVGIAGDTIVLTEGRFVAPAPMVALVVRQARVIQVQDSALTRADSLLAVKDRQLAVADSGRAESDSLAALYKAQIPKRPNWLARTWDAVKVPLAFVGGVTVAVAVSR